jgi:hypothetical protein
LKEKYEHFATNDKDKRKQQQQQQQQQQRNVSRRNGDQW